MRRMLVFHLLTFSFCLFAENASDLAAAESRRTPVRASRPKRTQPFAGVDALLLRHLHAWYGETRRIKKLEGNLNLFRYDRAFRIERRGTGRFFYERPDKGRLDIRGVSIKESARLLQGPPVNGRGFRLQSARTESSICDGKSIMIFDPVSKTGMRFEIPPKCQGKNVLEWFVPFLLGMRPEDLVRRYDVELLKETQAQVWLKLTPKEDKEKRRFKEAKLILRKDNHYLPIAVSILSEAGDSETVYTFFNCVMNRRRTGQFKAPDSIKFSESFRDTKTERVTPRLPDFRGMKSADACKLLKSMGFQVTIHKGSIAKNPSQFYRIEDLCPQPGTVIQSGCRIALKVYVSGFDLEKKQISK